LSSPLAASDSSVFEDFTMPKSVDTVSICLLRVTSF
jgi:hypothetical protein